MFELDSDLFGWIGAERVRAVFGNPTVISLARTRNSDG